MGCWHKTPCNRVAERAEEARVAERVAAAVTWVAGVAGVARAAATVGLWAAEPTVVGVLEVELMVEVLLVVVAAKVD